MGTNCGRMLEPLIWNKEAAFYWNVLRNTVEFNTWS